MCWNPALHIYKEAIRFCAYILLPLKTFKKLTDKLTDQSQFQGKGLNYGFVEYDDPGAAERAMSTLNGRRVHQSVSQRVPWLDTVADSRRKSVSTGLINPMLRTKRILLITSTFSLEIFLMRSTTKYFFRPFLLLVASPRLVSCGI
jgi:RNA recognition motif. (a.k.a. RRM, RBD, or RNP domain)